MAALLEKSPTRGGASNITKRSSESMKLGSVMDQARKVRIDLLNGKISRQEADRRLDKLRKIK